MDNCPETSTDAMFCSRLPKKKDVLNVDENLPNPALPEMNYMKPNVQLHSQLRYTILLRQSPFTYNVHKPITYNFLERMSPFLKILKLNLSLPVPCTKA